MNRQARRALGAVARDRNRFEALVQAANYLAHHAAPTAAGATLIFGNGETLFISADTARATAGTKPAGGHA